MATAELNIVVLVKYVPDMGREPGLNADSHSVDRSEGILSELDEHALEAAMQLVEARALEGDRVTAITMGPAAAIAALKKTLQMGAHEGVLITDDALVGSDAGGTSLALSAAIGHLGGADIILTGMASTDAGTSLVPAQLAERLGLPQITFASAIELLKDGRVLRARCDGDSYTEYVEAELPALLSVTDKANEPRYPSFKSIMAAKKKPITTLTLADLGLQAGQVGSLGAATTVEEAVARPPKGRGVIVVDAGDAGVQLVDFLRQHSVI